MDTPVNDSDWTTHSLNIHGVFFQKLIASLISQSRNVDLISTEYPVEFPASGSNARTQESRLDIRAWLRTEYNPNTKVNLLIECKKANPEFVDWIFFSPIAHLNDSNGISFLSSHFVQRETSLWNLEYDLISRSFSQIATVDDARETRGSYDNVSKHIKTKTSNAAITDAAYQVVLATHAIAEEDFRIANRINDRNRNIFQTFIYLPIIVTTAKLFLCKFDPLEVDITTGEISYDKVNLMQVDHLFYEYPIPTHLQIPPDESLLTMNYPPNRDKYVRRHILIVNSQKFEGVLNWIHSSGEYIVSG